MKYIFISDIHGNIEMLEECFKVFEKEKADKLIILGDTSAGTDYYTNIQIAELLNQNKSKIEVIRGNCDTIDFEEKLDFEIYDIDTLYINKKFVTITHGHYYNYYELPPNSGDIFIQGHTHIPMLEERNKIILANPGSVTRPRATDLRCYIIIDEENISLKTITGDLIKSISFS